MYPQSLIVQGAGNQFLLDFVGTTIDFLHPGIGVGAGNGVFHHVAVATVQLQTLIHYLALHLRAPPLGSGTGYRVQLAIDQLHHALVNIGLGDIRLGLGLGQFEAGVLHIHQALLEGLALLHITHRLLDHRIHRGDGSDTDVGTLPTQLQHEMDKALPLLLTKQVGPGNPHVLKEQLRGVLGFHAQLLQVATTCETLGVSGFHHDQDIPLPPASLSVLATTITMSAC